MLRSIVLSVHCEPMATQGYQAYSHDHHHTHMHSGTYDQWNQGHAYYDPAMTYAQVHCIPGILYRILNL